VSNPLDPPPSQVELVKDKTPDSIWKTWLYNLYYEVKNMISKDPYLVHAVDVIYSTYGDIVSVEEKKKDLIKFGRNEAVGTSKTTIMTLPTGQLHETYVSSDLINSIISDDNGDTQDVVIEGHTLSGGNFTFVSFPATLAGQTAVTLGTALSRVSRVYNDDSTDFHLAYSTWPLAPLFHYSEGVNGTRKHADMPTGIPNSYGKPVFFDVELKAKDHAIIHILQQCKAK